MEMEMDIGVEMDVGVDMDMDMDMDKDMDIDMDMDLDMDMYGGGHVRFCKGAVHAPDAPDAQLWDCGCVHCFVPIS